MSAGDLVAALVSFLLTLLILSYVFGDNPLFRFAVHLFIGVAAGYAGAVAVRDVLLANLGTPLVEAVTTGAWGNVILGLPPLVLGVALLSKLSPRLSWLGTPTMAYLVGVGAAAAIGGALLGTLFPQVTATINIFDLPAAQASGVSPGERLVEGLIVLVGTLATLMFFFFSVRGTPQRPFLRAPWIEAIAWAGKVFIAVTFGVLFAGVYAATLTALIERVLFLANFIAGFF